MKNNFSKKRFGLFIHWGLYAAPAVHEQYWQRWNINRDEYVRLADEFNPKSFDPAKWLDLAQEAGMQYLVFTAKHHDGFCMWDTRQTGFNIMNTPYGKDVFGILADECRKRNFPLLVYYSVVDWHHAAYPNIGRHHEIITDPSQHDMAKYVDYVKAQIQELCTNYGTIHGVWWDMNVPEYKDESIHELIRKLQSSAVINNRGFGHGDFSTPERDWDPESANPDTAVCNFVEHCQSVGVNSWGYRQNEDYFSADYLMHCIDKCLVDDDKAKYLLNVGPDRNGDIPEPAKRILRDIGRWMSMVTPAFAGKPDKNLLKDDSLKVIRNGKNLYVHCLKKPKSSTLNLNPLRAVPVNAVLMNNGRKLDWTFEPVVYETETAKKYLRIRNIPVDELNGPAVIKLEL
jgi:alpha-L-fucosidase